MMKRILSITVVAAVVAGVPAQAAISDEEFAQLKAQFTAMALRLSALEAENATLREVSETTMTGLELAQTDLSQVKQQQSAGSWAERIKIKGDFRYRYEEIDVEGNDVRERSRIRARAALVAKLPNDVEVAMGVASGGDDPVSTNQTLGGGGSTKDIRLDLAYFKWHASDEFYLGAGKLKNNYYRPQKTGLLWDGDYNPEGIAAGWNSEHLFANFTGNWLESDSKKGNQEFGWGLQAGVKLALGEASLTAGAGYYDLPTKGNTSYFGDDDEFYGNSFICASPDDLSSCVYRFNYEEVEVFADLSLSLFDMPLSLFANYVQNQDADDFDTGWLAGVKLGKASGRGTWQLAYQYQELEADAVLGLLSDSDFAGGGTDGEGHKLAGAYGINKQWKLAFTLFINNEAGEVNLGDALEYDRFMLDAIFKY